MKFAVPYENGMIFQHFGKSATFKVYETELAGRKLTIETGTQRTGRTACRYGRPGGNLRWYRRRCPVCTD